MRIITVIILSCLSMFCYMDAYAKKVEFGVKNKRYEKRIIRLNKVYQGYRNRNFDRVEKILLDTLSQYPDNPFARQHILNELSDLYSYFILDIEQSILSDRKIISAGNLDHQAGDWSFSAITANNQALIDPKYREKYVNISSETILKRAEKRLQKNIRLLNADSYSRRKTKYSSSFLTGFIKKVVADISKTYPGTVEQYKVISRLMKAEYELYLADRKSAERWRGYQYLLSGKISLQNIDLREIDFLSLSSYLNIAFNQTGDIRLAEDSLAVIYRPYLNLRNDTNRWTYNEQINEYINILINGYFNRKDFETTLYYISLNKSRMILEDRLRWFSKTKNHSRDPEEKNILPDRALFNRQLASMDGYLDFYIEGSYLQKQMKGNRQKRTGDEIYAPSLSSMMAVQESTSGPNSQNSVTVFQDRNAFITYVVNGKPRVAKIGAVTLNKIKKLFEQAYQEIFETAGEKQGVEQSELDKAVSDLIPFRIGQMVTVSPDKWLSKYPMDFFLGSKTVRALNLFTSGTHDRIDEINFLGYFNPTKDLANSMLEKDIVAGTIKESGGQVTVFSEDTASLINLRTRVKRNILHLSMHGFYNATYPHKSKLFFANSRLSDEVNDPFALYAENMKNIDQLKNNSLVFTAACETGLTRITTKNQSEIMGILRPLLVNNNKNIILTLWQVDDESAMKFVKYFYLSLVQSRNIKTSFFTAQEKIKKGYGDSPYHWAPYYLIQTN